MPSFSGIIKPLHFPPRSELENTFSDPSLKTPFLSSHALKFPKSSSSNSWPRNAAPSSSPIFGVSSDVVKQKKKKQPDSKPPTSQLVIFGERYIEGKTIPADP